MPTTCQYHTSAFLITKPHNSPVNYSSERSGDQTRSHSSLCFIEPTSISQEKCALERFSKCTRTYISWYPPSLPPYSAIFFTSYSALLTTFYDALEKPLLRLSWACSKSWNVSYSLNKCVACSHRHLYMNVRNNVCSQKVETIQMSTSWWVVTQNVTARCNEIQID